MKEKVIDHPVSFISGPFWDYQKNYWVRFIWKNKVLTAEHAKPTVDGEVDFWQSFSLRYNEFFLYNPKEGRYFHYKISAENNRLLRRSELVNDDLVSYRQTYEKWSERQNQVFASITAKEFWDNDEKSVDLDKKEHHLPAVGESLKSPYSDKPSFKTTAFLKLNVNDHHAWDFQANGWIKLELGEDGKLYRYQAIPEEKSPKRIGAWGTPQSCTEGVVTVIWDGVAAQELSWFQGSLYSRKISRLGKTIYQKYNGTTWEAISSSDSQSFGFSSEKLVNSPPSHYLFSNETKLEFWSEAPLLEVKKDNLASSLAESCINFLKRKTHNQTQYQLLLNYLVTDMVEKPALMDDHTFHIANQFRESYLTLKKIHELDPRMSMTAGEWDSLLRQHLAEEYLTFSGTKLEISANTGSGWEDKIGTPRKKMIEKLQAAAVSDVDITTLEITHVDELKTLQEAAQLIDEDSDRLSDQGEVISYHLLQNGNHDAWRQAHILTLHKKLFRAGVLLAKLTPKALRLPLSEFKEDKQEVDFGSNIQLYQSELAQLFESYPNLEPDQDKKLILQTFLALFQNRILNKDFNDNPDDLFYNTIKIYLKKIYIALQTASLPVRRQVLRNIINLQPFPDKNTWICSGGVLLRLTELLTELTCANSIEERLIKVRDNLFHKVIGLHIQDLTEQGITLAEGWEAHLGTVFKKYAAQNFLGIPQTDIFSQVDDKHADSLNGQRILRIDAERIKILEDRYQRGLQKTNVDKLAEYFKSDLPKKNNPEFYKDVRLVLKDFYDHKIFEEKDVIDADDSDNIHIKKSFLEKLPQYTYALLIKKGIITHQSLQIHELGNTDLINAAASGDNTRMQQILLTCSIEDINHANNAGDTALICAARKGRLSCVRTLLKQGFIDVTCINHDGEDALQVAVKNNHLDIAIPLLARLASKKIDIRSLTVTAENNHIGELSRLISSNDIPISTIRKILLPFFIKNDVKTLEALFNLKKIHVNGVMLSIAAEQGKTNIVKFLLDQGVSVNYTDPNGRTPLILAAKNGHLGTVEKLLTKQPDIKHVDRSYRTALDWCKLKGHKLIRNQINNSSLRSPPQPSSATMTRAQLTQAFEDFANERGYKSAQLTFQNRDGKHGPDEDFDNVTITFDKTILYNTQIEKTWRNIPSRIWNWIHSRDTSFNAADHAALIEESLYDGLHAQPSKITVTPKPATFLGFSLPWKRQGTSLRNTPSHATQPASVSMTWSKHIIKKVGLNNLLESTQNAGIYTNRRGLTTSKRDTWNPLRRLILACLSPTRRLHKWARSKEWGSGSHSHTLDVPIIESGALASIVNILLSTVGIVAHAVCPLISGIWGSILGYAILAKRIQAWIAISFSTYRRGIKVKEKYIDGDEYNFMRERYYLISINNENEINKFLHKKRINMDEKPVLFKKDDQFFVYGLSEKEEWQLTELKDIPLSSSFPLNFQSVSENSEPQEVPKNVHETMKAKKAHVQQVALATNSRSFFASTHTRLKEHGENSIGFMSYLLDP